MKVGVLGSGDVARTLAAGFLKYKHDVTMGTRDVSKLAGFAKEHPAIKVGSFADAARFGELLVLAVMGSAASDVLRAAGREHIAGKTVIDPTNAIQDAPPVDGVLQSFTGPNESLMEQLQHHFPDAHFVKAFSCIGNAFMVNPDFQGAKPTMFICGNDAGAKTDTRTILDQFGFDVADMGGVEGARAIEPLCILWCIPGFLRDEWSHAFKLLKA